MSDSELTTIKKLDEKRLTRAQTAELLGIYIRQVQRILNRYRQDGGSARILTKSTASNSSC
ncbi:MAG: helix-turn-helix domain-containing protein [Gammaproteobacteria bacterium]|nr:helix-turn-helix domain-containing protein [Gammaproteobacteria bacterium]MCF6261408.1 helix-turn-helix domain-containing protein [Gammaproteobacteria bacterium]